MCTGLVKGAWHRFYSLFGYSIEIRIQSPTFQADLRNLERLVDDRRYPDFRIEHARCVRLYGDDPELVRIDTLASFLCGDE